MKQLTIAIPTYNRHQVLYENLVNISADLIKYNVGIYISDDSPNDETKNVIERFKHEFPQITVDYIKNTPSLGHDYNGLATISSAPGDYVWYMGDGIVVINDGIKKVVESINEDDFDAIVVSTVNRVRNLDSQVFTDSIDFYEKLSWSTTLTGISIYNKIKVDELVKIIDFEKYVGSNFMQLAILLELLAKDMINVKFINEALVVAHSSKSKSYWEREPIKTFCQDWCDFNFLLPCFYPESSKKIAIYNHDKNTKIFHFLMLLKFRADNALSKSDYKKHQDACDLAINNIGLLKWMMITPIWIAKLLQSLYSFLVLLKNKLIK